MVTTLRKYYRAIDLLQCLPNWFVGAKNRGGSSVFVLGQEGPQWQAHRRQALYKSDSGHRWPQPSKEQPQISREQPE